MARITGDLIAGTVDRLVRWLLVPVTSAIPRLVSSGLLLVVFAAIWIGFGTALVANPGALDELWRSLGGLPLPIQGLAWLLFLPVLAGMWVWQADWPAVVRLALIAGIAGWNLLAFVPRSGQPGATALES